MKEVGHTVSPFILNKNPWQPREIQSPKNKGFQCRETESCGNRGWTHRARKSMARGKTWNESGKANHFAVVCRSQSQPEKASWQAQVKVIATTILDDSQLITLKLESGKCLRFHPNTGAQCNVIPLHLFKKASKDHKLKQVKITSAQWLGKSN